MSIGGNRSLAFPADNDEIMLRLVRVIKSGIITGLKGAFSLNIHLMEESFQRNWKWKTQQLGQICVLLVMIYFNIFVKNPPRVDCSDICDIDIFISLYFMLIVFSCVPLCLSI